ncbi:MAG: acyltransferase [Burkholderiaceae bacterium]|jgi:peptidoglycan/LPS O-acetylase OafA/YrhL|nr:acyltransferase [Burkholderiaceae bacterium]
MPLLDAVKGGACLLIVGHHLSRYGPLPEAAALLAPQFFQWLSEYGRFAVQVFLVLAGFFAAGILVPDGVLRADRPLSRLYQRYARLVAPYLAALIVCVLANALARPYLGHQVVSGPPNIAQLIAHSFLLQDLLGYEALSTGVWYVAIDFQLFVLALVTIAAAQMLQRRWFMRAEKRPWLTALLLSTLIVASLTVFNRDTRLDITAFYFFGSYGLGMLAFWVGRVKQRGLWGAAALALVLLGAAVLAFDWRGRTATAWVSALILALIQRLGGLEPARWPAIGAPLAPLAQLGRISYSLFLIHFPVLLLVSAAVSRGAAVTPWAGTGGLLATLVLSIGAAAVLHRYVESQPLSWRRLIGLFAALLVCGAAVSTLSIT